MLEKHIEFLQNNYRLLISSGLVNIIDTTIVIGLS